MIGTLEYSVVGFCKDLTDPKAKSEPVAVVAVFHGPQEKGDGKWSAIFVGARADLSGRSSLVGDDISRAILDDLPTFLVNQAEEGLEKVGEESLMSWIHHNLRNSLHVSEIGREHQVEIEVLRDVVYEFINIMSKYIIDNDDKYRQFDLPTNVQFWPLQRLAERGRKSHGGPVPA